MAISSDAVVGHLPSPYSQTLDCQSAVLPSSNPSEYSCLPSRAITHSNLTAFSSFSTTTSSSDKTLDGYGNPQIQGDHGFYLELSTSNGASSSAKVVSSVSDGNCSDPMLSVEEQLKEEVSQFQDQSSDDAAIDARDYDSLVSSDGCESLQDEPLDMHRRQIPFDNEYDFDDHKSAMETEPEENRSRLPVSSEYPPTTFYGSCICNRYGRLNRHSRLWNPPCGLECESHPRVSDSWDSSGGGWGYDRDDRPISFTLPAETGVGAGLYNLGNTCFLNAILQCFTHTVPLVKALRSSEHLMPCQRDLEGFCVVCALRNHIERSLTSSGKIISPSHFVDNLNQISSCFHRYQQEDAHEFLQCLLDKLERCCFDSTQKEYAFSSQNDNIVQRVFGGRLVSKLRCCNCGHCSDKFEPLIDLSLEIEDAETLEHALESFTKVEKIEDIECDNCKVEVSMEKQLMLDQVPSVAALHLKRFKSEGSSIEKIRKPVGFPLQLDFEPYSNGSQDSYHAQEHLKYQLYAVVVHNGFSPTSGHYFCYIRSSPSVWHNLDDSMVVRVEEEMVLSEAAYILFYVREDTPWFSSLMEAHKDPNTSPKSVLDRVESECTTYPRVENSDECKASVNRGDIGRNSTPLPREPVVEDDQINQNVINTDELTAQISCASKTPEAKWCFDESGDVPKNDASASIAVEATNYDDKFGGQPSEENNIEQVVHRIQKNDFIDPLVAPSSPVPEIYAKQQTESRHKKRRDGLKLENGITNEKKLKKGNRDERMEAMRYIQKNVPSSRGMKLLAAMVPRNDKKRRLRSSPCKQGSPPGGRSKLMRRQPVLR